MESLLAVQDACGFDSLNLSSVQQALLHQSIGHLLQDFESNLPQSRATYPNPNTTKLKMWLEPPPESSADSCGPDIERILHIIHSALETGVNSSAGSHMSYIPNGGLLTGAMGRYLAAALNQYTGMASISPGAVAMEQSLINWMTDLFGLGESAGGVLLSGGSISNFNATVAARCKMGDKFDDATVYVSSATHHSVSKACRLAGIPPINVRVVPVDRNLRMDCDALNAAIQADVQSGLRPMMIVATAGTTDTGAIDPLNTCAALAKKAGCWFHVDAAYGGFFMLTQRGRLQLEGIEQADSITVDAHKSLFLPFGVGALLVARKQDLTMANTGSGHYLQDNTGMSELTDFCQLGPELTRPNRGLDMWLPLHLHGVAAFRNTLDRMLDLARSTALQLRRIRGISVVEDPALSVVCFRSESGDADTQRILSGINAGGKVHLSSSIVQNQLTVRVAFLNFRTTAADANEVISFVKEAMGS